MFDASPGRRTTAVLLLVLFPAAALPQSGGNQWNPFSTAPPPAANVPFAPPKFIGDAPVAAAPVRQQPAAPSKFAPPGLDQRLDAGTYQPVNPSEATPPQQFAPPPQGFATNQGGFAPGPGINPGYGAPYPGNGFNGYPQASGGYPQGFNGYPPAYGAPQGYGYPGYPGYGSYGPGSPYGSFGNFPGNFSNGGMPGFGFSPFGFF